MTASLFTDDFKSTSWWLENTPLSKLPEQQLPAKADVVIVGAGYTGLSAAIQTARGGLHTVVLDAADAGAGCSTRNGGQISTSIKPDLESLTASYGAKRAFDILREGHNALHWIEKFVNDEKIDCHFQVTGKFTGAHNPAQYEKLSKRIASQVRGLETDAWLVPRSEQHSELGSDRYFGGAVFPRFASLDPARLHHGLLERALEAQAVIVTHNPLLRIERNGSTFRLVTASGSIEAGNVVIATNGYTGKTTPWMRRRVIPIGSYIIATEPLAAGQMDRLIPRNRVLGDTRKKVFYYRATPDRQRILFGGRVSLAETDPHNSGRKLHSCMVNIFPELASTRISHSWMGFVGYTFDSLAHLGIHDGIHYAMGYCGSGVSMANYFGMRIGQQVLGRKEGRTAFDGLTFQARPYYTGKPWFLAPSIMYYDWIDRMNR